MVRLEGQRLVVREWRADEVDAMHAWLGDPRVGRFITWGARDRAASALHLAECVSEQSREDRRRYYFAIELDGEVIGDAGFDWKVVEAHRREGEIGYFLRPEHWGQGYATEAARLVLSLAFDELGATVMRAACFAENTRSERVMQRLGMRRDDSSNSERLVYTMSRATYPGARNSSP